MTAVEIVLSSINAWTYAFWLYVVVAILSLFPVLSTWLRGVRLKPGGPSFEDALNFSSEAKKRLNDNFERMRGTLGFWKQQAAKYERLHLYCMLWIIILSAVTPVLTVTATQQSDQYSHYLLTATIVHLSIISGVHKFFKTETNFKAFRQGESEFYDVYRRMLDNPEAFGLNEDDRLKRYFSDVALIRKQVRNAETDTYAGLEELRQAQNRTLDKTSPDKAS